MRITRNQLRQIIQEETRRLSEGSHVIKELSVPGSILQALGKYFADREESERAQWNKTQFLSDLKELQGHLPDLIKYVEGVEGDSWTDVIGPYWGELSQKQRDDLIAHQGRPLDDDERAREGGDTFKSRPRTP